MATKGADQDMPSERKLDFFVAVNNRSAYLDHFLQTGLALDVPGVNFVVFDDASDKREEVAGKGDLTVAEVCRSFNDPRIVYVRNDTNLGFAASLRRYVDEFCRAEYVALTNPKDEFISGRAIAGAISKLDADPAISLVLFPIRHMSRDGRDEVISFNYPRMSGQDFVAAYVRDSALQHCGSYAIFRASAARRVGIPRDLQLRRFGIEDGSGIDHDMLFNLATTGDAEFETEPPIRRRVAGGYTEIYPLSFAYSQYQYARRLMRELEPKGFVSAETRRHYLSFWHLIVLRGLVVAHRPVHGTEREDGEKRIRPHLGMPLLLYLVLESLRFRLVPSEEALRTAFTAAVLSAKRKLRM